MQIPHFLWRTGLAPGSRRIRGRLGHGTTRIGKQVGHIDAAPRAAQLAAPGAQALVETGSARKPVLFVVVVGSVIRTKNG